MLYDVGALDELPERRVRMARVGRHDIALIRQGERVFALRNRCPHQAAPLCAGPLRPRIDSPAVGLVAADGDQLVVSCPWHGWEFDVESGRAVWDGSYRAKTYPTKVRDGRVLVEVAGRRDA